MDFINPARRENANKEQGEIYTEKSYIVSHNNFLFIDNFYVILQTVTVCNLYEQINLL